MSHTVSSPPPDSGGGSFAATANRARATFSWVPPHDMPPAMERRRTERAERMRLQIEEMLNEAYSPLDSED